eukprot:2989217-Pyramimonas_sp.AAC.1
MESEKYSLRFAPALTANMPNPVAQQICNHRKLKYSVTVLGFINPLQRQLTVCVEHVFTLSHVGDDA